MKSHMGMSPEEYGVIIDVQQGAQQDGSKARPQKTDAEGREKRQQRDDMRSKKHMAQRKQTGCEHVCPTEQEEPPRQDLFQFRLAQGAPGHFLQQRRGKEEKRADSGPIVEKKPADPAQTADPETAIPQSLPEWLQTERGGKLADEGRHGAVYFQTPVAQRPSS